MIPFRWGKLEFDKIRWLSVLRLLLVAGVLLLAAYLGRRPSQTLLVLIGTGLASFLVWIILSRWPALGLFALLPVTFFVRWGLGTGTQTKINMTLLWLTLLFAFWLLRKLVIERDIRIAPSRLNLPAILMIISVTLSLLAGGIVWVPFSLSTASIFAQVGGWMMFAFPMGLVLLAGNVIEEERWLKALVAGFLGIGSIYILLQVVRRTGELFFFNGGSVNPNFWLWMTVLVAGLLLFHDRLVLKQRLLLGLFLAAILYIELFVIGQRVSNWVPPLLAIAVLIWLRSWRWGLFLGLLAGVTFAFNFESLRSVVWPTEEYSAVTRLATWPIMFELVKTSPLLGLGPANYYHYTPLYSIMGYHVKFNSHNNYWDMAAQVGLLGLGLFLWLSAELGMLGLRLRRLQLSGFARAYVNAALAGLAGTLALGMLADWFFPFVYNIGFEGFKGAVYPWLFLGGLLALEHILKPASAPAETGGEKEL